ncbi:MAG: antibiotic biosynthesis monooxygenase [Flavobacteriales bacterium]|jgi:heme oxygenase (mycobilin-producing)|nr:antibiotic biosynthesis monooxygenase [Flavobacteriales bacterium]
MSKAKIIRIVRMTFTQETLKQFEAIFRKHENAIGDQPGCFKVELVEDSTNPLVRATVSIWDSEESLNDYRKSELFGEVWPETKRLFAAAPEVVSYINLS